jgi:hypothetical protein
MYQDFWLLPTKFQLTTLTRLYRSSLSIPIVYLVSACSPIVPIAVNQSLVVALALKRLDYVRQRCAGWSAELTASPSPVYSSRLPAYTSLRSFHRYSRQFSFAAINWANSVRAGEHRLPVTAQRSARLPATHRTCISPWHRSKNTIPT